MSRAKKNGSVLPAAFLIVVVILVVYFYPEIKVFLNDWKYDIKKTGEVSNYEVLKEVEDKCRAMIANYEADKKIYEQYVDSSDGEKSTRAEQARKRANSIVDEYNDYILKNEFVWSNNVPDDIYLELEYLE